VLGIELAILDPVMQHRGQLALGDVVASHRSRVGIEDRQRDVLEPQAEVGVATEVEWLDVPFDRDR
jgi:hypothetical protein